MALAVVPLLELVSLYKSKNNPTAAAGNLSPSLFLKRSKKKKRSTTDFYHFKDSLFPAHPTPSSCSHRCSSGYGPRLCQLFLFSAQVSKPCIG